MLEQHHFATGASLNNLGFGSEGSQDEGGAQSADEAILKVVTSNGLEIAIDVDDFHVISVVNLSTADRYRTTCLFFPCQSIPVVFMAFGRCPSGAMWTNDLGVYSLAVSAGRDVGAT